MTLRREVSAGEGWRIMRLYRRSTLCVVVAAVVAVSVCGIGACTGIVIGISYDRRTIVGPYGLVVGDGKFYLILDQWESNQPCGILDGAVTELGWNDQVIVVNQETGSCGGKPSGWMIINVKTGLIEPPVDSARLHAKFQTRPELSQIQVMPVRAAWDRLKR